MWTGTCTVSGSPQAPLAVPVTEAFLSRKAIPFWIGPPLCFHTCLQKQLLRQIQRTEGQMDGQLEEVALQTYRDRKERGCQTDEQTNHQQDRAKQNYTHWFRTGVQEFLSSSMIDTMSVISLGQKSRFRMLGPGSSSGCSWFLFREQERRRKGNNHSTAELKRLPFSFPFTVSVVLKSEILPLLAHVF